ncbi:MAG: peptidylprolyl isomerase, partial [Oscillospiraceae bacterium]|nr:peptidylprolyl isomerase [Oscillospiraceae bacterium]
MKFKAFAIAAAAALVSLMTVGCGKSAGTTVGVDSANIQEQTAEPAEETPLPENAFRITLYPEYAPITCENFETLVSDGFYNGLTFHRVVDDFMAQGGDPSGTGAGGSKKKIKGEFSANGVDNPLSHTRGVVSMARSNDKNGASSQFFICYSDKDTFLDGNYAAFGKVSEGMEVVDSFLKVKRVMNSGGELASPTTPIAIDTAKMISKDAEGHPRVEVVMKPFLSKTAATTAATTTAAAETTTEAASTDASAGAAETTAAESTGVSESASAAETSAETTAESTAAETTSEAAESTAASETEAETTT